MKTILKATILVLLLSLWALPSAWAQSGKMTYEVTITNLTNGQTLSPPLLASHESGLHAWQMGELASEGVQMVAESGTAMTLASELEGKVTDLNTASDPIMPGQNATYRISANEGDVLSAAMMLGQTNDTFTGLDSVALTPGTIESMAYDAGTEDNTELASDVPGAPFMGMNHPATEPQQPISENPGLANDADLDETYDWNGAVARFEIRAVTDNMPSGMPDTGRGMMDTVPYLTGALFVVLLGATVWTARRNALHS